MELKHYIAVCLLFLITAIYIKDQAPKQEGVSIATSTHSVVVATSSPITPKSAIYNETVRIAVKYHLDQERFSKVIFCESNYNPKALNSSDPYGGSRGVGQFLQPTFDHYKIKAGLPEGDLWNYKDSIEVMGYMWSINQQSQWSVYRILYGDMQYMEKEKANCEASYSRFLKSL